MGVAEQEAGGEGEGGGGGGVPEPRNPPAPDPALASDKRVAKCRLDHSELSMLTEVQPRSFNVT